MYYLYLQETFMRQLGVQELRPWQEAPLDAIYHGHDVFVTAPTGGGKSILYQLPALMGDGLTVVISPLKALQVDQVSQLQSKGVAAALLNSDQPKGERKAILYGLSQLRLLYLAPEQLRCTDVRTALMRCRIGRIAVDEAHVLPKAQLGFRRAYGEVGEFIASLPRRPQVIACTATATQNVCRQILSSLGTPDADVFHTPVRRDNLHLKVKQVGDKNALYHSVERALKNWKQIKRKRRGSVIIYCPTVKAVKRMLKWLKSRDWKAQKYTGKMPQHKREKAMKKFMSGESPIMVATNAFGLGINKTDVRLVIHAGLPLNMSGYVQEIGRAGRDGKKATCILFYTKGDHGRNKNILSQGSRKTARQGIKDLDALAEVLKSDKCLWQQIERYFGERPGKKCRQCCRCKFKET